VTQPERSQSRRAPGEPARPESPSPSSEHDGEKLRGAAGEASRQAADAAEPAGDQDPAVEAERTAETDRLRDPGQVDGEDGAAGGDARPSEGAMAGTERPADDDPMTRVEAERDEYLALAQRTQADFDNYRKRAAREVAGAGARAKAELARAILPAVDNLERALDSATDDEARLAEGVRLVLSELVGALERNGVASIEPAGEPFDPNLHEALSTRSENGTEPGVVLDVVQKGYRLDQTVLRPARVVVAA
jgi:molecular chaperone GrpE